MGHGLQGIRTHWAKGPMGPIKIGLKLRFSPCVRQLTVKRAPTGALYWGFAPDPLLGLRPRPLTIIGPLGPEGAPGPIIGLLKLRFSN